MRRRIVHWPRERPMRTAIGFLGIALGARIVHRVRYERVDQIPATGPALIVANHLSTTETLALARLITGHHRFPHFLTKEEVFGWPVAGRLFRAARQIPVVRGSARAAASLEAAARELQRGHVVCLYPEGRLSTAPDLRPGPGRTGAARLALAHPRTALIPVGMWGARPGRRHLWHRHTVRLVVGQRIDLTPWIEGGTPWIEGVTPWIEGVADEQPVGTHARELTELIMKRITRLTEAARGAPFDD